MNQSAFRILFALVFVVVTVSEAVNLKFGLKKELPRRRGNENRRMNYYGQPFAMPRKRSYYLGEAGAKRATYVAFPRAGRGYLALPRMGRSQGAGSDAAANGASCCTTGLKKEWLVGEEGKMAAHDVCQAENCCPGFQEVENTKPDGTFYTMCVPKCGLESRSPGEASDNMMLRFGRLLRN